MLALSAPPETLYMSKADFVSGELTFSWSRNTISIDCAAMIHYNILASNCGNCPTTTNHTNVTCTGVPTSGNLCMFALETVVCGHIIRHRSETLTIQTTLKGTDY